MKQHCTVSPAIHTSGHADCNGLLKIAFHVNPCVLIPVHTDNRDLFFDKFHTHFQVSLPGNGGNLKNRLYKAYDQADYAIVKINGEIKNITDIKDTSVAFMKSHHAFIVYDNMDKEVVNIMK